jgi:hypothetical protein
MVALGSTASIEPNLSLSCKVQETDLTRALPPEPGFLPKLGQWSPVPCVAGPLHSDSTCATLERSKKRGNFKGRRWGALERRQRHVDRTIPHACERYGIARGANRTSKRANQLSDDASQVARQRPCIAPGADHDGEQKAAFAGLSQPTRPGSVSPDC